MIYQNEPPRVVSTHSHPKVAGQLIDYSFLFVLFQHTATRRWLVRRRINGRYRRLGFNTQPPEGGWIMLKTMMIFMLWFQHTATRRWLELVAHLPECNPAVSTHSHPKVAGWQSILAVRRRCCFNTQPPEGGWLAKNKRKDWRRVSTHSHPKVAGGASAASLSANNAFQHTATRRWLARCKRGSNRRQCGFNTQPPEGGWRHKLAGRTV